MDLQQLLERLKEINTPGTTPVVAEHADLGEGGNVQSNIIDVIVEDGKVVLVTDHAI